MTEKNRSIEFLLEIFEKHKSDPAFIYRGKNHTYAWLLERISHWRIRLNVEKILPGSVVAITGDYSPEICALFLALIECRAVTVPFASVTGQEKESLSEIADLGYEFFFEGGKYIDFKIYDRTVKNPLILKQVSEKLPSLIVFSSGSTGKPKGILHDFGKLLDKFRIRRKTFKTLTFLQLDHLGGINTLLYAMSNAGTVISVPDRTPSTICEAIEKYKIELLPVTPSFLNLMLVSGEYKRRDLTSLKIISYGTEVMPQATLEKVRTVFPDIHLQQTYGLSELGVLRTKSREDGSLWVRVGGEGFQTKIIENTLWIKAHSAMLGYLNAPDPFDSEGWFNTEDQVEVDGEYFRILGRKSDVINVGGQKVFPSEVESILIQMENIKDAVVMGENNFLMGNIVITRLNLFKPEAIESVKRRIREFCVGKLSPYKIPVKIEVVPNELHNARFKRLRNSISPVTPCLK